MVSPRLAARTLAQSPFVTTVAVLSLALGIGANAAIFSIVERMLLQSLPVREPGQLRNLLAPGPKPGSTSCNQAGGCDEIFSYPMFRDLQAAAAPVASIVAHRIFGANLAREGQTTSGTGMLVSGNYFQTLGVRPAIGRLLGAADDQNPGEHFVAVLGHSYWTTQFGADPEVLGTTLTINGHPMAIVGVAPRGFVGTTKGTDPDVFVPITMRTQVENWFTDWEQRSSYWIYLFARLEPGVSDERAHAAINATYSAILQAEAEDQGGMSADMTERFLAKEVALSPGRRGQSELHGQLQTPLLVLFAITSTVLLIACANIANLMLARGATRKQEMAIRGSLGASRSHLLGQLLTESCLLALLGGAASVLVARGTLALLSGILPASAAATYGLEMRPSVIAFALITALGTGLAFGLYPALHATRSDLAGALRASTGQQGSHPGATRFRNALVITQLALSMTLLTGAGLFIKSLVNVSRVDLGLRADNVVAFDIAPVMNGYAPEETRALFAQLELALAAIPGVERASSGLVPLLTGSNWGNDVNVEGWERGEDVNSNSRFNEVGPGYFSTLGIPLRAGREFTADDTLGMPRVAVINETFARKFGLDPRSAVGKRMSRGGDELDIEIVGLIEDAKYSGVKQETPPLFYLPYRQDEGVGWSTFYLRTVGDPEPVIRAIPTVVAELDPNLPIDDLKTLEMQVRENIFLDRFVSMVSAAFAVLATVLAAIGLYGVLAYTVAQRAREIGVRMALGATSWTVQGMVMRQVGKLTLVGGFIGIGAALALGQAASSLLFELDGSDPTVLAVVAGLLVLVSLGAGYLPARRASKVDPMHALRT